VGVGVCAGLGMLSKYTIALLGLPLLFFMLVDPRSRRWFFKPEPYLALLLALFLFLPVIVWNAKHGWASFIFQGPRRFQDSLDFTLPALLGSVLVLLAPTGAAAAFAAGWSTAGSKAEREGVGRALGRRGRLFIALFTVLPFLFFLAFSLGRNAKLNWTGPLWLAIIPLMAWQMAPAEGGRPGRLVRSLQRAWPFTVAATMLFFGAFLHFWVLGLPGLPYPKVADFSVITGWRDLAQKIELVEKETEISTEVKPWVVGMDKNNIASELAFYRHNPGQEEARKEALSHTLGRSIFGMDSLMFGYCFPSLE